MLAYTIPTHPPNPLLYALDTIIVDEELHDAYATRKEYIEVHHLHGYGVMLWTNNARSALKARYRLTLSDILPQTCLTYFLPPSSYLQARQAHLVAVTVVKEVVDDILDFMLEGWHFGERESAFTMIGYVPSVKPGTTTALHPLCYPPPLPHTLLSIPVIIFSPGGPGERIRAGQDQIRLIGPAMEKIRARAEAKKQGQTIQQTHPTNIPYYADY